MPKLTLERHVLQRAARLLGSEPALARYLQVPHAVLETWLDGSQKPTRSTFLATVDLLLERGDISALEGMTVKPAGKQQTKQSA